jgi:hypothetical protein
MKPELRQLEEQYVDFLIADNFWTLIFSQFHSLWFQQDDTDVVLSSQWSGRWHTIQQHGQDACTVGSWDDWPCRYSSGTLKGRVIRQLRPASLQPAIHDSK